MRTKVVLLVSVAFLFGFFAGYAVKPVSSPVVAPAPEPHRPVPSAETSGASERPLSQADRDEFRRRLTENPNDLDALLGLLESTEAGGGEGLMQALSSARTLAWDDFSALGRFVAVGQKHKAYPLAYSAAARMIELESRRPEGHQVAGRIAFFYLNDYAAAEKHYTEYLELAPDAPNAPMIRQAVEMIRAGQISKERPLAPPDGRNQPAARSGQ